MIHKYKHIIAYLLLFTIATVCFPVQEFFHDHHSDKEICEIESHHKCNHTHHINKEKHNIGCHFCLLHKVFITHNIYFESFSFESRYDFTFIVKFYQNTYREQASRGPPFIYIS